MPKLFSSQDKKFLNQIEKTERDLNKFICNNWENLFPQYKLIKSESFDLENPNIGVHSSNSV